MTLRVGSLFSGIGGVDLGFMRAGMETEWLCEFDAPASSVLARHWPTRPNFGDVTTLTPEVLGATRSIDVLCGGFPCQDLSVAGKRAGLGGKRSGLFYEFMRLASDLAPRWVVIENVPGLLSSRGGRDMGAVVGTLAELGYGWAYRVLDAQYFGVAQRRRRVFIVGCLGNPAGAAAVLFEPEGRDRNPPTREEARTRITGTLAASSGSGGLGGVGQSASAITSRIVEVAPTLQAGGNATGGTRPPGTTVDTAESLIPAVTSTLQGGGKRGYRIDAEGAAGGLVLPAIAFYPHSGLDQVPQEEIAPPLTIGSGSGANPVGVSTGMSVRRLTPRECERLQGFPDDWTAGQSDAQRYRQLGNAVCVNVAEWIGKRLLAANARFFDDANTASPPDD